MSEPQRRETALALIDWLEYLQTSGPGVDEVDSGRVTVTFSHHEIHEGNHYTVAVVDTSVDIIGPKYARITTPNSATRIHFVGVVSADGAALVEFYEDPTLDVAGSALVEYNNERNSPNNATATTFEDTTTQAPNNDGTLLFAGRIGGTGLAMTRIAGSVANREEWVLGENEDYLIKVTVDGDGTEVVIVFTWYEV